ncbi:MAG TPA: LON peptidase substrate-binding domain-containing protein [Gaiellaceae bacterium]|nr:LON peptidase substrate-binding domain-containing protein [Gaiellaceae bacterium]
MPGELGLFPLGIVVLPGELTPLHIFEPRYRELVGEAIDSDTPFGILLTDDDGLRDVGTTVRVTEVVESFDDGRFVVVVEGGERFRLLRFTEGRSFRTGEVETVADGDAEAGDGERRSALELFEGLRDAVGADVDSPEVDDPELSYAIARRVEMDARVKQDLLESVSEPERLEILSSHLRSAQAQLELVQEHSALARRNGNLRGASGGD